VKNLFRSVFARHNRRHRTLAAFAVIGVLLAASCTPAIIYDEDITSGDGDGDNIGDGDDDLGTGATPGDGDGDGDSGGRIGDGDGDLATGAISGDGDSAGGTGAGGSGATSGSGGSMGGDTATDPCDNNRQDGTETDKDCGGDDCDPCRVGEFCEVHGDCRNLSCIELTCQDPSCTDGEKNGDGPEPETDLDCGGSECKACDTDLRCILDRDCISNVCEAGGFCAEATCGDNTKNGTESAVDCGGPNCEERCEPGMECTSLQDCVQPPDEDPASTICESNQCALLCSAPGLNDCNQDAADGCETNINTDPSHCGACQAACDLPNVIDHKCEGGGCVIDFEAVGCALGFLDVNGDPDDGCEVNSNTDPQHCGAKNNVCSASNGVAGCYGGECTIACTPGFADCDLDAESNGCEVNTDTSILHCGVCDNACTPGAGESAYCDTSQATACQSIRCDGPTDCGNTLPCGACGSDGVCDDRLTDSNNCGGCGLSCSASNASTICEDLGGSIFTCAVDACVDSGGANYENCDATYANGCETDVLTDVEHCGACSSQGGTDCTALEDTPSLNISAIQCSAGGCQITGCVGTFADCDRNSLNGCEVDTGDAAARCGGCAPTDLNAAGGVDCTAQWSQAFGACENSACVWGGCSSSTWGDCNELQDACETDLTTESNCLACDAVCSTAGSGTSANSCTGSGCSPTCATDYDTCDSDGANGCETYLPTSTAHCGSCSNNCTTSAGPDVNTFACVANSCEVTSCDGAMQHCTDDFADGCESDSTSDFLHCGGCDDGTGAIEDCTSYEDSEVLLTSCDDSSCQIETCSGTLADCDNDVTTGCEVNTADDPLHCGSCSPCAAKPNATADCSASTCSWICADGTVDTNGDLQLPGGGCETVSLVNSDDKAVGANNAGVFTVSHSLESALGSYRLVVVAVASEANGTPLAVSYDSIPMNNVETASGNSSTASIWILYDSNLPSTAGTYNVAVTPSGTWGQSYAEVLEFKGAKQYAGTPQSVPSGQASSTNACGAAQSAGVNATGPNSLLYGFAMGRGSAAVAPHNAGKSTFAGALETEIVDFIFKAPGTDSSNQVAVGSAISGIVTMGRHSGNLPSGNHEAQLTLANCWNQNVVAIKVESGL
jgi:hypothetical protein